MCEKEPGIKDKNDEAIYDLKNIDIDSNMFMLILKHLQLHDFDPLGVDA